MESVVLVGYMGCGKSTIARELRLRTGMDYMDTDQEIEKMHHLSISEIFARAGEATFRDMETEYLRKLVEENRRGIISTGGGLPLREENRRLLKQLGNVIYLQTSVEALYERLRLDRNRPLLQGYVTEEERIGVIRDMLEVREPIYLEAADEAINTDGMSPLDIAEEILLYMAYN